MHISLPNIFYIYTCILFKNMLTEKSKHKNNLIQRLIITLDCYHEDVGGSIIL